MTDTKINLLNDYNYSAHPDVLSALIRVQNEKFGSYGLDSASDKARSLIAAGLKAPQAEIHFIAGGTQCNLTAMSAFLRSHEAVIAVETAHIFTHETGAIEATGHKVLTAKGANGKLRPKDVEALALEHGSEHMVKPRLVYISQTSELGTIYSSDELQALRKACNSHDLLLYIDGARLSNALAGGGNSAGLSLDKIAAVADAFYIGGTKNGLLFGEAMVICNPDLQKEFRYTIKQHGGLLGKGFLFGIQFAALFEDGLFFELGGRANYQANALATGLTELGYDFVVATQSNQVFPIVNAQTLKILQDSVMFNTWEKLNEDRIAIRFVTTWMTSDEEITSVLQLMS